MNSRERITALIRGGNSDVPAWFAYFRNEKFDDLLKFAELQKPDAIILPHHSNVRKALDVLGGEGPVILVETLNPFGLCLSENVDINEELRNNPVNGNEILGEMVSRVSGYIDEIMSSGADGVFYRLIGAEPKYTSPMQYGGYYLEHDNNLLSRVTDARCNVLFVEGGEDVYMDFVHDIPASLLAWDENSSGLTLDDVKQYHGGALACGMEHDIVHIWERCNQTGIVFFGVFDKTNDFDFEVFNKKLKQLRSPVVYD
jgi:hypothetical protein